MSTRLCEMIIGQMHTVISIHLTSVKKYMTKISTTDGFTENTTHDTVDIAREYSYNYIRNHFNKDTNVIARVKVHGTCRNISEHIWIHK